MKKIFALALAAVMTAGMTTVAFAAKDDNGYLRFDVANGYAVVDKNDDGKFGAKDIVVDFENEKVSLDEVPGGKKVAILLYNNNGLVNDKDDVKGFKVKTEWSVGGLEDKAAIELVKFDTGYYYAVTFTLPEGAETKFSDLAGQISVYKNSSDLKDDSGKADITLKLGAEYGYAQKYLEEVEDDMTKAQVVIFKDKATDDGLEGEETLTFGDFEFEVDITGQDKLNLKNNVDFDPEFAAMYDYANIDFVTFEKSPRFNKIGTAYIYADEDAFIYEVTDEGAKAIKGLQWDPDYEAWTFKTRTLGSYAISDVELDEKTVTEDKDDSSKTETETGKPNPDTGR